MSALHGLGVNGGDRNWPTLSSFAAGRRRINRSAVVSFPNPYTVGLKKHMARMLQQYSCDDGCRDGRGNDSNDRIKSSKVQASNCEGV